MTAQEPTEIEAAATTTATERAAVKISAPSRLHFGLASIGSKGGRTFGGVGLMIDQPRTHVEVVSAGQFSLKTTGGANDSVAQATMNAITLWHQHFATEIDLPRDLNRLPIELTIHAVDRHSGLGSGTQIALSTALTLHSFFDLPNPSITELALSVGRGKRSAIGSYGFFQGGFLVDRGIESGHPFSPLDFRSDFPEHWPVLIVSPASPTEPPAAASGGLCEQSAFDRLPPTPDKEVEMMHGLIRNSIIPAVKREDFDAFAGGINEYGYRSGSWFADLQGGPWASDWAASVIKSMVDFGTFATGQSSWGPNLFAIAPSREQAERLAAFLDDRGDCHVLITTADNGGVRIA